MAKTFSRIKSDSTFAGDIQYTPGMSEDPTAYGNVNFSASASVNNLNSDSPAATSGGTPVPAHCLYLVATGRYLGVDRKVGMLMKRPAFPYALASTGAISSTGNFLVGALPTGADPKSIDVSSLVPAGLLCDGLTANFSGGATVVGDAKTAGKFSPAPTVLKGHIYENISPEALPQVDVTTYDPGTGDAVEKLTSPQPAMSLEGLSRCAGPLHISGDVTLKGGLLYVDGDLTIDGGISGTGAVFSTGKVVVHGASSVVATNLAAIVAKGDVSLTGSASTSSYFQGLVMSAGGTLSLHKVTVMGAALGINPAGTALDVVDARFFYDKKAVTIGANESFANNGVFGGGGGSVTGGGGHLKLKSKDEQGNAIPATAVAWAEYLNGRSFLPSDFVLSDAQGTPLPTSLPTYASDFATALGSLQKDGNYQAALVQIANVANPSVPKTGRGAYTLDLNQFFKPSEQLHIVYCKSL
jgi:hypothetical protein